MTTAVAQIPPEPIAADSMLWQPVRVGALAPPHRLAMAPMTRDRSAPDGSPTELNAEYYRRRASTALIRVFRESEWLIVNIVNESKRNSHG